MPIEKNWKYYLGIILFAYSFIPYITVVFIPLLKLPHATALTVAGGMVASAEIAFFFGVVFLGKPFIEMVKAKVKGYVLKKRGPAAPAPHISQARHYTGITLLILSFLPYYAAEVALLFGHLNTQGIHMVVGFMLMGEALFIISLFILGGEFWDRLKKLLEWPGKETGNTPATNTH